MIKLFFRLIAFGIFVFLFGSAVIFIALASLGWIDIHQMIPGLPPAPQIQTQKIPGDPFGQITVPANLRPGQSVPLKGQVQPQPLLSKVPVPQQISTEPKVVGANFSLAVIMMLVFGITSNVLTNMLRDEEPRIQKWLRAAGITKLVKGATGMF